MTTLPGLRMTSISESVAPAQTQAAPKAATRNAAFDHARSFLTLVVVLHHAVIPYTHFGHTDAKSWIGFDMVVLATDSFFMAMFFFLSGLFVWPSLMHKTTAVHLRDRLLRLGLPFAIAAVTVIPIAYYAIALRQETDLTFAAFWWKTVTVGPWPSGPLWFVWVLLAFDLLASLLYRLSPNLLDPIHRLSEQCFDQPAKFFLFLLAVTALVYIPALIYFGPNRWFEFGPFSVQASRILLYASYFFIGAGIGVAHLNEGVLSADGRLAKSRLGLVDRDPHSLLPDVGADLHQARNTGQSRSAAHMVSRKLRFFLRRLQRGHPVRHPRLFPGLKASLDHTRSDAG